MLEQAEFAFCSASTLFFTSQIDQFFFFHLMHSDARRAIQDWRQGSSTAAPSPRVIPILHCVLTAKNFFLCFRWHYPETALLSDNFRAAFLPIRAQRDMQFYPKTLQCHVFHVACLLSFSFCTSETRSRLRHSMRLRQALAWYPISRFLGRCVFHADAVGWGFRFQLERFSFSRQS